MLDELRRLFLEALEFPGGDATMLIERWNAEVKGVAKRIDNLIYGAKWIGRNGG